MPRLEQLDAWTVARQLAVAAYRLTLTDALRRHFGLIDQIRRCAVSVPSNFAEGYGQGTQPQFRRGTRIALGSAYELLTQLHVLNDLRLIHSRDVLTTLDHCHRAIALLTAFLKGLGAHPGK